MRPTKEYEIQQAITKARSWGRKAGSLSNTSVIVLGIISGIMAMWFVVEMIAFHVKQ